jgi:peptidoglycan/xylan/chitin deacetylase (PgdA/CDA1 family)
MNERLRDCVLLAVRWSGLTSILRRVASSRGMILMFHEIQVDPQSELMTGVPVWLFEHVLSWLRRNGWVFVGFDEALRRLAQETSGPPFAVLTFDDGYRDSATVALPILERYHAPATFYIPTGAPTRTLPSWWLALRALFRSQDELTIDPMEARFHCPDHASKVAGLDRVTRWVHQDYGRVAMLMRDFVRAGISLEALNNAYFLSEEELASLARHPLVTIGAHTSTHPALATLDEASVSREVIDNRAYLETLIGRPVRHFAYPYGTAISFSARDEGLLRRAGFASAVTTCPGHLSRRSPDLFALPRTGIGGPRETKLSVEARLSGIIKALSKGWSPIQRQLQSRSRDARLRPAGRR